MAQGTNATYLEFLQAGIATGNFSVNILLLYQVDDKERHLALVLIFFSFDKLMTNRVCQSNC